jgi:nicotinamide mononucleotide transporter
MSLGQMVNLVVIGGISWFVVAQINTYFGATSPILDTGILVLSIVAQYLLGLKKIESWLIWIAVNVLSIYVYGSGGAFLLAFQYFFFLLNAIWGFYRWWISYLGESHDD